MQRGPHGVGAPTAGARGQEREGVTQAAPGVRAGRRPRREQRRAGQGAASDRLAALRLAARVTKALRPVLSWSPWRVGLAGWVSSRIPGGMLGCFRSGLGHAGCSRTPDLALRCPSVPGGVTPAGPGSRLTCRVPVAPPPHPRTRRPQALTGETPRPTSVQDAHPSDSGVTFASQMSYREIG